MARTEIPIVVLDATVSPPTLVEGATVSVLNRIDNSEATVYQDFTGDDERTQPLTTDEGGRVSGYLDRGSYKFVITIPSRSPYNEYYDSAPGLDGSIDGDWLADDAVTQDKIADDAVGTDQLDDDAVTQDKIADNAVGASQLADNAVDSGAIASGAVTTGKIADGNVTLAKLGSTFGLGITRTFTFALGGVVIVPANNTTDINLVPGFTVRLLGTNETLTFNRIDYLIHGGTSVTFGIYKNGTAITGWSSLSATTTPASNTLGSPVSISSGDYIQLRASAVSSSPNGLSVSIHGIQYPLG